MDSPAHDEPSARWTAQTLFWALLDQAPAERETWLAAQPVAPALADEVRSLLAYHDTHDGRLARPAVQRPTSAGDGSGDETPRPPPQRLGDYTIVTTLASGGMGTVYEARQASPCRAVAIKVLQRRGASAAARRRFAFEAEALARLRHPAIAQIFEAVLPDEGSDDEPYLVMELVPDALPITRYAATAGLSRQALLTLFCQVCDAVHHGHQRGVIHRDLKPGNILVNGEGQPKLIDFGVARLVDRRADADTVAGQVIGTLAYMAPEQIEGAPDDLDTRADVHALGVVLFELLTGRLPVEVAGLPVPQASRLLIDTEPPPPSRFDDSLKGDLDVVVATALARDRERRYASAAALAADLRRHLAHLPLDARPPSLVYLLGRFAKRRRALVTGIAVGTSGLILATSVSLAFGLSEGRARRQADEARLTAVQAQQDEALARSAAERAGAREAQARADAERSRDEALAQRAEADAQRALASAAEQVAATEARALRRVLAFFVGDVLTLADASQLEGETFTVLQAVKRAATLMDSRPFADDPRIESAILLGLGQINNNLGLHAEAEPLLRRALELARELPGLARPDLAATLTALAIAAQGQGELSEAGALTAEALALGDPADEPVRRAETLLAAASLARDLGQTERGLQLLAEARTLLAPVQGPLDDKLLACAVLEASLHELAGQIDTATRTLMAPLGELIRTNSQDSLAWLRVTRPLAALLVHAGNPSSALQLLDQARQHAERLFHPEHESVARCLNTMGRARHQLRDFDGAARDFDNAIELFVGALGPASFSTLVARGNRAAVALETGDLAVAREQLEEVVARFEEAGLPTHDDALRARAFLGEALLRQGDHAAAEAQLLAVWDAAVDAPGEPGRWLRSLATGRLILLYDDWGREAEAQAWRERADEPSSASGAG